MSGARAPSLQARLSLVLTVLIAVLMGVGAAVWMRETRQAIHEEVEAATRVAQQWLVVVLAERREVLVGEILVVVGLHVAGSDGMAGRLNDVLWLGERRARHGGYLQTGAESRPFDGEGPRRGVRGLVVL